jgi:hypothetical protein
VRVAGVNALPQTTQAKPPAAVRAVSATSTDCHKPETLTPARRACPGVILLL